VAFSVGVRYVSLETRTVDIDRSVINCGARMITAKRIPHVALALVVGAALTLGACTPWPRPHPGGATTAREWANIDHGLSALGPKVGLVAARVLPNGTCRPVHQVAMFTPRPTASQFKLFVLGALAEEIAAGRISWDQTLTVTDAVKSAGNSPPSLQYAVSGTKVSVEETATKMISISDNTAADMLIGLVGRHAVEAQARRWTADATADEPFLTTREMFLLHYVAGLADRYLATPRDQRDAFLASSVDPLPLGAIASAFSTDPRYVDQIEWFASPADVCRAFAGLQRLAERPALAPLSRVLSIETGTIGLGPPAWRTVWFKGGSEPGVLTLGWLATNRRGRTFVVEAMVTNPDVVLSATSITDLVAIARRAFAVLGARRSFTPSP